MFSLFQSRRNHFYAILLMILFVGHCAVLAEEEQVPQQVLDLREAASACLKADDIAGALGNYQAIIQGFSGTKYALDAQRRIVETHIKNEALAAAQTEMSQMLSTYSNLSEDIDDAFNLVTLTYYKKGHYQQVVENCQYMLSHWPDCNWAMWAVSRQAQAQIRLGNLTEVERLIGVLKSQYSEERKFGRVLCRDIAKTYVKKGYKEKALQLWNAVSVEFPAEPISNINVVYNYLKQDDMASAISQIDKMFIHATAENGLIEGLRQVGVKLRKAKQYDLEQSIYDRLLQRFPDYKHGVRILASKTAGYLAKGDFSQASSTIDELFSKHSGSDDFVKYLHGLASKEVRKAKQYDLSRSIYDRLLQQFPEDGYVPKILRGKVVICLVQGDVAQASATVDKLFAKHSGSGGFVKYMHKLAAKNVRTKKQYDLEQSIYDRLLQKFPSDERAPNIVASKISSYIKQNDMTSANETTDVLFSNYTEPTDSFVSAVSEVVKRYSRMNDAGMVIELCNRMLAVYPNHEKSLSFHGKLIKAYLDLDSKSQADNATAQFLQKYSSRLDFAKAVNGIAYAYRKAKHYEKAIELYQVALAHTEDVEIRLVSYAEMGKAKARMSGAADTTDVDGIVQKLMTDFKDAKRLGYHIFQIGEAYYFRADDIRQADNLEGCKADFQKAISVWHKSINEIDDPYHQAMAAYFTAVVYRHLEDYQNAANFYQRVVTSWPSYKKAWDAQFTIAKMYETLKESGAVSSVEADAAIVAACQNVIDQYPNCPAVYAAQKKLEKYSQQ